MLPVRFLVDACVDVRLAHWLRERGYDARHLRDEGLSSLPNGRIFSKAIAEGRVVVTHDLDFGEISALTHGQTASVIVFRLHNPRLPRLIERLSAVLAGLPARVAGRRCCDCGGSAPSRAQSAHRFGAVETKITALSSLKSTKGVPCAQEDTGGISRGCSQRFDVRVRCCGVGEWGRYY